MDPGRAGLQGLLLHPHSSHSSHNSSRSMRNIRNSLHRHTCAYLVTVHHGDTHAQPLTVHNKYPLPHHHLAIGAWARRGCSVITPVCVEASMRLGSCISMLLGFQVLSVTGASCKGRSQVGKIVWNISDY
ncbi:uncharacterized protein BP01DRAFT_135652 [Aspergillus saccharolyticus JOP 1030-1]|uniref:Uncharacterized protein n=1 Tax=Aspergillus saccharolyticus JOP 1030-1 TaxID=1450539 RepID=A0A319A4U6_9EURO|nr:hypothetical protein BP01DRAFT_135652 [Aspergillus saccharolyticus JOP 1030-1]PYH42442.1 hypothetical protein BP01DRAFT_135652 [Aspergillus saccharolyticus JOP 1030-1]